MSRRGWLSKAVRPSLLVMLLLGVALLTGCRARPTVVPPTPAPGDSAKTPLPPTTPAPQGGAPSMTVIRSGGGVASSVAQGGGLMLVQLSEGSEITLAAARAAVAAGTPLSADETRKLLDRLPPLTEVLSETQALRLPVQSLPAPRPGETISQPFPPPGDAAGPAQPPVGPLKVLRFSPEGDVPLAPFLSVTFDQPMVPLTALSDLAAKEVPVKLTPLPEGAWHWVGTQTLTFEPRTRFPMATRYEVEVPAGTTSASGGKLGEAVRWSFTTPTVTLTSHYPSSSPTVRNPLLFAAFDQRIQAAAVLATVRVTAGSSQVALRLASAAEVEALATVRQLAKQAGEGRWLAFVATSELPADATITVEVGPGTPSAEGPRTTDKAQRFTFKTYGPLKVTETQCGYDKECPPLSPWWVRFSNPLDENAFEASLIQITPELPGAQLTVMGNSLTIQGRSKGRTTYKVTLKAALRDAFGQTLGADQTVSFAVGSAQPVLYAAAQSFVVLDPASSPTFSVYTINYGGLRVRVYAVQAEDWPSYLLYQREAGRKENPPSPPGRQVFDGRVPVENAADQLVETAIDLRPHLKEGRGHLVLVIEPEQGLVQKLRGSDRLPVVRVWVQASRIAVDAFVDGQEMLAWATSLSDGKPLVEASVQLAPGNVSATTDKDGLARFTLSAGASSEAGGYLVARTGQDVALLPESLYGWGRSWAKQERADEYRWYVFDDRKMYRPGEEVHVKGWVRRISLSKSGDIYNIPAGRTTLTYELADARGNKLTSGTLNLNALGGFDTAFKLPANMNLGQAYLRLRLSEGGPQHNHALQVQEFRRPEFEVAASASPGPHFAGSAATASVKANYYAGGPLTNAEVRWNVTSSPGSFRPPAWDDFSFGIWRPWWESYAPRPGGPSSDTRTASYNGRTDASGTHNLRLDLSAPEVPQPLSVRAEATVMDVNRQAWTSGTTLLVHPAELYVGLRSARYFVERGQPLVVEAIVSDLDGHAVADRPIELRVVRLSWAYVKGSWQEQELDEQTLTLGSRDKPVSATFKTTEGGTYRITATLRDAKGRANLTQITRWVSGGQRPRANRVEQEAVLLIPDREEYRPGDTAEILVQSPFTPAEGLLTLRRNGLVRSERFHMDGSTIVLRVPIEEAFIPNLRVQVDLTGAAPRLDAQGQPDPRLPTRPAYASGELNLAIPPLARTLALSVTPREKELEPGGETTVEVLVKDAAGRPVPGAELAVVVVDEAVLALTNYQLADPVALFYPQRGAGVTDYYLRSYVLLTDPAKLIEEGARQAAEAEKNVDRALGAVPAAPSATMMRAAAAPETPGGGEASTPIRMRSDFNALATFAPAVPTDAQGRASVRVKVPDNLTRYRVMVVAVLGEKQFGKGESSITARLPLMVRPSPPRFLNFGDRISLPVVVQNQTDKPLIADVAVRGTNIRVSGSAGQRVTVPARDRLEVRFALETASAGTARVQVGASSGAWADASEFSLPVYTPATTEAFAVYGTVDAGAVAQPVIAPSNVFTQFGGLEISTSSTALQALSDAVLYLTAYPYECSEQLASRILAVAALRDVLTAFRASGLPARDELVAAVQRDLTRLQGLQNGDGGFPIWERGRESWPYYSIHATHALVRAEQKGFTVAKESKDRALKYLREIETHYPSWYSQAARDTMTAYALYVRALLGDADTARARKLVSEGGVERLQPEAIGWLFNVLARDPQSAELAQVRRYLANRVVETAGAAHFVTSFREEDAYLLLASNRRADGIILEALMQVEPKSDLISKIVRGLLANRTRGRWGNTQENVFILLALDRYFNVYEAQTPDFVARVWLGEQYAAEFAFRGRSTDYQQVALPMSFVAARAGTQNLVLSKEGSGRLYYRLGLSYAPRDLDLKPLEQGFTVQRVYEAVDDPADVRRDAEGVWHIKAGARVRVRLKMVAPTRRYHVALVDPLPAGLEALNPALAVTGSIPQDPQKQGAALYWWWRSTWYEHQNLRDERAEAFASLLWEGVHTYTYVARATTPGSFIVPPTKAEEMYAPEVFGRSASDRVVVE